MYLGQSTEAAGAGRTVRAGSPGRWAVWSRPALRSWLKRVVAVVLLGVAGYETYLRRTEVSQALDMYDRLRLSYLALAIVLEAGSMVVFARLQRWLLQAGGVQIGLGEMVEITLAGNALGTSLPGGAAWAATWAFGQLRRRGADRVLAGWVILVAGALASFALFVLVAVGAWVAGNQGPVAHLRWLAAALAAIPVVVGAGFLGAGRTGAVRRSIASIWAWARDHLPGAAPAGRVVGNVHQSLQTVKPGPVGWLEVFGLALANWVDDAACLVACTLALHVHVPWRGLLVIYALTQISASLPITPGGLGVVEGSMAALLVAYGTPGSQALAVVLLYRIVSFWGLVPIGWGTWFWLEAGQRFGRRHTHPWAEHSHGYQVGAIPALGPERLMRPAPCPGCEADEDEPKTLETPTRRRLTRPLTRTGTGP
ncbi:MAG: lysylphosphatidylglycerol synthase transmembrane domain-containing protein [Acidimicrobiales bacterium]